MISLRKIKRLQENGVSVNEGTMFVHLIRKDGLPNSEDVTDEEELVLAKIKSLDLTKTDPYPYNECKENVLPALLEVSDEVLNQ